MGDLGWGGGTLYKTRQGDWGRTVYVGCLCVGIVKGRANLFFFLEIGEKEERWKTMARVISMREIGGR